MRIYHLVKRLPASLQEYLSRLKQNHAPDMYQVMGSRPGVFVAEVTESRDSLSIMMLWSFVEANVKRVQG